MKKYILIILGILITGLPKQIDTIQQGPIRGEEEKAIEVKMQSVSQSELKKIDNNIKKFKLALAKLENKEAEIRKLLKTKKRRGLHTALNKIGIKNKQNALEKLTEIARKKRFLEFDIKEQMFMRKKPDDIIEISELEEEKEIKERMVGKKLIEARQLRGKISKLESEIKKLKEKFNKKYGLKKPPLPFKELLSSYKI